MVGIYNSDQSLLSTPSERSVFFSDERGPGRTVLSPTDEHQCALPTNTLAKTSLPRAFRRIPARVRA